MSFVATTIQVPPEDLYPFQLILQKIIIEAHSSTNKMGSIMYI